MAMKRGERIRLIQECADSLRTREWPMAQLILDQFGMPTWEPRDNDWEMGFEPYAYFVDQVKAGTDDALQELHEYLLGEDAGPAQRSGPWSPTLPLYVFLSHIHQHREFIGEVKRTRARMGIDAFVAHDDIQPSQQWREVIKGALSTCDALVAFLHPGFHESQWCDQEVGWALGRGIPIITVRPPEAERHDGFLEEHQDLFLSGAQATQWWVSRQVFDVLLSDPRTRAKGVRALAEAFVHSPSYDETRRLWAMLEEAETIDPEQLRRLEYAVQTNRQVYEAIYPDRAPNRPIPELVAELVTRQEPPPSPAPFGEDEPF